MQVRGKTALIKGRLVDPRLEENMLKRQLGVLSSDIAAFSRVAIAIFGMLDLTTNLNVSPEIWTKYL